MSRLGAEELATAVRNELITYLRDGTINEDRVARTLDISDLQIADLDRLKRIHFCLSESVVEFVDDLPDELRRIKTANHREHVVTQGEVRGRIDWEETTQLRYEAGGGDRTRFACETPYTEYDIPENLVLKKLLWVVQSTVESDIASIEYGWATERWTEERRSDFSRLYGRNIHLNRIQPGADISVTARMLSKTRSARQSLYRRAYKLYDRYERLLRNEDDADVRDLLQETLVVPERIPRLFELFCVFRLLHWLARGGFELQVIGPGTEYLAKLETDDHLVKVYHDRTGSLSFHVDMADIGEVKEDYFRRYRHAKQRHHELVNSFLGVDSQQSLYSGRPDIVLEVYELDGGDERLTDVLLGEVKYTASEQTFSTGLKELIEYLEFAQLNGGYLMDEDIGLTGLLMTDTVETASKEPVGPIAHVTTAELLEGGFTREMLPESLVSAVSP